jgi:hypothetical protein
MSILPTSFEFFPVRDLPASRQDNFWNSSTSTNATSTSPPGRYFMSTNNPKRQGCWWWKYKPNTSRLLNLKAATPDAGMWCLQGMGMPIKFSMATPADLHKVPEQSTQTQSGTSHGVQQGGKTTLIRSTPKVSQPGSTTPITTAMSGFSMVSPNRGATSTQHPPAPLHHTPALDPTQGTYYAVFDPTNQTITPLQNQCNQPPYQMVGQYQPPPYQYQ